jgi:putative transposase
MIQCHVLLASVSGYHQHLARLKQIAQRRHLSDEALLVHIAAVYAENRGAYGWPRIWRQLRKQGIRVGKMRVQRLMKKHGIHARGKRRFRVVTTDSKHDLPVAENVLNRNFTPAAPNQSWVGDFTYIATKEGWLFLAVVIDLFSRKVIGWSMRSDMQRDLVIDAREMAWFARKPGKNAGLVFHSDRGSQAGVPGKRSLLAGVEYASDDFRKVLEHCTITPSMSRKGNCWDNACSETLFGSLKVERLYGEQFETIREAKDATIAWLLWYNQTRMHSTLDYISPVQFEENWAEVKKIAA